MGPSRPDIRSRSVSQSVSYFTSPPSTRSRGPLKSQLSQVRFTWRFTFTFICYLGATQCQRNLCMPVGSPRTGCAASCDAAYTRTPLSMHHGMHPPPVPDQRRHTHARTRHTLEFNTTGSRRHLHIRCTSDYTTSPCRSHWLSYPRRRCSPAQLAGHPRLTSSWP